MDAVGGIIETPVIGEAVGFRGMVERQGVGAGGQGKPFLEEDVALIGVQIIEAALVAGRPVPPNPCAAARPVPTHRGTG